MEFYAQRAAHHPHHHPAHHSHQQPHHHHHQHPHELRPVFEPKAENSAGHPHPHGYYHHHNRISFDNARGSTPDGGSGALLLSAFHRSAGGGGGDGELRASWDDRDLPSSRADVKDAVRASFQRERSRSIVDGREIGLRESPRFGGGDRSKPLKDPPRASVDGRAGAGAEVGHGQGQGQGQGQQPMRASMDSPRLSMRIKEAVRAAVEGRLDSVRASFDSKDAVQRASAAAAAAAAANAKPRETPTPRSASADSQRLLVELRESPRLSRDAPRYSCDGRDAPPRVAVEGLNNVGHSGNVGGCYGNAVMTKDALRAAALKPRDSPRLSVDGRSGAMPVPAAAARSSVDERESPRLPRDLLHVSSRASSYYQQQQQQAGGHRAEIEGKDHQQQHHQFYGDHASGRVSSSQYQHAAAGMRSMEFVGKDVQQQQQQQSGGETTRRRVPSLVARLMGLEDLPNESKSAQTSSSPAAAATAQIAAAAAHEATPHDTSPPVAPKPMSDGPQKRLSKESKLLKGLLQYNPRTEEPKSGDSRAHEEAQQQQQQQQHESQQRRMFATRPPPPTPAENAAPTHHTQLHTRSDWSTPPPPRKVRVSPKQLGLETMPGALRQQHQEAREIGVLRQKVVQAMPKQLTEAVLTVLKNADDDKKMPMSYADMENRLRQLRVRSSLQEHKTLRQILEAMQSKGLLNGALRTREGTANHEGRHQQQQISRQHESKYQHPPKQILLPKPQEYHSDAANVSKMRNLHEFTKLASKLQEQALAASPDDSLKRARLQAQSIPTRSARSPDEQQQSAPGGAPIVLMKPIMKPAKKSAGSKDPSLTLTVETVPGTRSASQRGRESAQPSPVRSSATGFGYGREQAKGGFNSEEGATFKVGRERGSGRVGNREVHSEPGTPRSPKLIALPQSASKLHSSPVPKETSHENIRNVRVDSGVAWSKSGESPRRGSRASSTGQGNSPRTQTVSGSRKSTPDVEKSKRKPADGKLSNEKDGGGGTPKSAGPAEVVILRNRTKRVSLPDPELRPSATANKRSGGTKSVSGDKTKEKALPVTTPRSPAKKAAEMGRKKDEQGGGAVPEYVRVTDGDAVYQSNVKGPVLVGLNRFPNAEIAELERECQGAGTPRANLSVKMIYPDEGDVVEEMDATSEQLQPSPVSVLDPTSFHEEDVSPLALSKNVDAKQGGGHDGGSDSALQEWRQQQVQALEDRSSTDEYTKQLTFLRESAKILPPQGDFKPLILNSQAEKVYVRDVLVVSGVTMGMKAVNPGCCMIDVTVFDYLEEKQGEADSGSEEKAETLQDKERQVLDRRMLFDCVNDALTTLLVPFLYSRPWMQGLHIQPLQKRPTGQVLVQQLWDELTSLPPEKPSEDICDSLYTVLEKDLVRPRNSWTEFVDEVEDIGLEVEKMIFKDLIEEALFDMAQSGPRRRPIYINLRDRPL